MFTQEEIKKLPKWAQGKVNRLEADIITWRNKADQVAGESETNVFINHYPNPLPLPKDSDIKFQFEKGEIRCRIIRDGLEIHAMSYKGRLAILPNVSNAITAIFIND